MSIVSGIMRPSASTGSGTLERMIRAVYGGGPTSSGVDVNTDSAMSAGAVYTCILVLAQSLAQLHIHLYERKGRNKERAYDHYLYQLLHDQPNEWMTSFEMKQLVMVHLLLHGNSIWLKTQLPGQTKIRELIPIQPIYFEGVSQDEQYRLTYKIRRPSNSVIDEIPASKILHFRGLSTNGYSGLIPIEKAREMIGLSLATEKHGSKLFANGARLGGIISHPNKLTQEAHDRLKTSFNEAYAGVENAHKTALIEEGMKWEKITMTAEDSQFLESRKYQRSEIAGFFRVPPHMIGDLEKATFSNIEHQDLGFVKHSLMPYARSFEQTCKKDLMTPEEKRKYYFEFNAEDLLRGDTKSRSEAHSKAILGGWLSPNEVREMENRNPYEGGDEYRVQMNTEPVGGSKDEV